MPKPKKPKALCALCTTAWNDPLFKTPQHLAHPVTGDHMLFDLHGRAKCPECGAQWRRVLNMVELVEF